MKKNKKSWLYYLIAILVVLFGGTGVVGTVTDTETTKPQEATIVVEEQIQAESQVAQEEEYVSIDGFIRTFFYPDDGLDYFSRQ